MEKKIHPKDNKVLKHIGQGFWSLGLVIAATAFLCAIIAVSKTILVKPKLPPDVFALHSSANVVGTVGAIFSSVSILFLFIGFLFRLPSLCHTSPSKFLWSISTVWFSISLALLIFCVPGLTSINMSLQQSKDISYAAIATSTIGLFLCVLALALWCIYRFRHTTFAKVHDFDTSKK